MLKRHLEAKIRRARGGHEYWPKLKPIIDTMDVHQIEALYRVLQNVESEAEMTAKSRARRAGFPLC